MIMGLSGMGLAAHACILVMSSILSATHKPPWFLVGWYWSLAEHRMSKELDESYDALDLVLDLESS